MTTWKSVIGSQAEKPAEWDTTSSASTVYQRRNIEQIEAEQSDGTTAQMWSYEERQMSMNEMTAIMMENQNAVMEAIAALYEMQIGG